jgi:hypothetical protein
MEKRRLSGVVVPGDLGFGANDDDPDVIEPVPIQRVVVHGVRFDIQQGMALVDAWEEVRVGRGKEKRLNVRVALTVDLLRQIVSDMTAALALDC